MVHNILGRIDRTSLKRNGFTLAVVENALPEDYYDQLAACFPSLELIAGRGPLDSNHAYRRMAAEVIGQAEVPAIWQDFVAYHTSGEFFDQFRALLGDEVERCHPLLERNFGRRLEDFTVGVRGTGKSDNAANQAADVMLDCQLVVNSPVTAPTSVRGPHLDSPFKLFAGLLYFRHPDDASTGGDLEFFRLKRGRYPRPKPSRIARDQVEPTVLVPYRPNTLVLFINGADAIHGVTPRSVTSMPRRYINFLGECYRGRASDFFITPDPGAPALWRSAMRVWHRYL